MVHNDNIRESNRVPDNTRRQFVAGTIGAVGGVAAGVGVVHPAFAQQDEDDQSDEDEPPLESEFEDDAAILNYARTLEFLEADFYRQGLANISEDELCNCGVLDDDDSAIAERVYDELQVVQAQEQAHAETLGRVIGMLDAEAIEEPEFEFGVRVEYPDVFLATAVFLEDLGVSAYAGAAPFLEDEDLVVPTLGIHSVEARHASFARTLTDQTGFPDEFDNARSRSEVEAIISEFIVDTGAQPDEDTEANDPDTDVFGDGTDNRTGNETDNGFGIDDDTGNETDNGSGTDNDSGNETDDESPEVNLGW